VTDLHFAGCGPVIDFAIHDQTATDTASERDVKHSPLSSSCTMQRLTEGGYIGIVINRHRQMGMITKPGRHGKIAPTGHMMALGNLARLPSHRTAESNANSLRIPGGDELRQSLRDLASNTLPARGAIDYETTTFQNPPRVIAGKDLEFGTADFDGEEVHKTPPFIA
jgi:hypothetical protein